MSAPERLSEAEVAELFEPGWLTRCDYCGWPIVPEDEPGCWESNCSMRPMPSNADTQRKATVRKLLAERRALREALASIARERNGSIESAICKAESALAQLRASAKEASRG